MKNIQYNTVGVIVTIDMTSYIAISHLLHDGPLHTGNSSGSQRLC